MTSFRQAPNQNQVRRSLLVLLLLTISMSVAASSARAQSGLALLRIEPGAAVGALGGAAVALRDEGTAYAANPALGALADLPVASLGYNSHWTGISLTDLTVAPKYTNSISGLLSVRYAGVSEIERRTSATTLPSATFGLNDFQFRFGGSVRLTEQFSIGAAAGFVFEKIDIWRGSAFSVDLGAAYRIDQQLTLGLAVTQLGSSFQLSAPSQPTSNEIKQPTAVRAGASYQKSNLLLSSEVELGDDLTIGKLGAGYQLVPEFGIRGGYRFGDDSRTFSAGIVAQHDQFSLGYSVIPYQNSLGTAHLLSLGIHW